MIICPTITKQTWSRREGEQGRYSSSASEDHRPDVTRNFHLMFRSFRISNNGIIDSDDEELDMNETIVIDPSGFKRPTFRLRSAKTHVNKRSSQQLVEHRILLRF